MQCAFSVRNTLHLCQYLFSVAFLRAFARLQCRCRTTHRRVAFAFGIKVFARSHCSISGIIIITGISAERHWQWQSRKTHPMFLWHVACGRQLLSSECYCGWKSVALSNECGRHMNVQLYGVCKCMCMCLSVCFTTFSFTNFWLITPSKRMLDSNAWTTEWLNE